MTKHQNITSGQIAFYQSKDGKIELDITIKNDNIWLTQSKISELFTVDRAVITKHLQNIYESKELEKEVTCAKIAQVRNEGSRKVKRVLEYYNLDVILSVRYRINSAQATKFRIWANSILKNYLIKGFVINQAKLKENKRLEGSIWLN